MDEGLHSGLKAICCSLPNSADVSEANSADVSEGFIFWQQQMQAATKINARMMHWHP